MRRVRFGPFELDRQTGELWKHGLKVKLQGKPFQVLEALIERPGEPVTREELQHRLWSGDTFVDFESGLNTAANRLRITLGDSADNPRYVETLSRSGYRFVAPVEEVVEAIPPPPPPPEKKQSRVPAAALILVMAMVAMWLLLRPSAPEPAKFQPLTFRRGPVGGARFAPDGQTIIYSAQWESEPWRLFLSSSVSPETRTLGFEGKILIGVSRASELALLSRDHTGSNALATLFRVPLNGGAPLAVSTNVICSDWSADGRDLAAIRFDGREARLEFPIGKVLYRPGGLASSLRFSPDGKSLAFFDHPIRGDDLGDVKILDVASGKARTLSPGWNSGGGIAWAPSGKEVWFSAARIGGTRALWAVNLQGGLRLIARVPGSLRLEDIAPDGRVLIAEEDRRVEMAGRVGHDTAEHDLSWFDWSGAEDFSADGKLILFDESADGGGPNGGVFLRRITDGNTIRLGEGHALALAPDGRSAIIESGANRNRVTLVPVGEGQPRELSGAGVEYHWVRFFPDGQRLLLTGKEPGGKLRLYIQPVAGGKPQPIVPEVFLRSALISPDGKRVAGANSDNRLTIVDLNSGERRVIPSTSTGIPVGWSADGGAVLVRDFEIAPTHIYRVDLATGRTTVSQLVGPANATGMQAIVRLMVANDEKSYVYSFSRTLSKLYLVTGWK
jgi:eukaryotic-like serine/threonine-protein kinase